MLTVALPKGRIAEQTLEIFAEIFGGEFKFEGRELILDMGGFRFLNVRNQDVPTYVEHGAADIGVVGLDVITEKELDIIQLLDMQLGKCKVAIGIKNEDEQYQSGYKDGQHHEELLCQKSRRCGSGEALRIYRTGTSCRSGRCHCGYCRNRLDNEREWIESG